MSINNEYIVYGKKKSAEEVISFLEIRERDIAKNPHSRENLVLNLLGKATTSNLNLLDYGCGWGYISRQAASMGWNVTASDISSNEIEIAKLIHSHLNIEHNILYSHDSIDNLPADFFDAIISIEVIEHVHNPGLYLSRINRVLKKGGNLIISIPNIMTIDNIFSHCYKTFKKGLLKASHNILEQYNKADIHINSWDAYHFTQLVSSVGFQLIDYMPMEHWPLPPLLYKVKNLTQMMLNKIDRMQTLRYSMLFKFSKVKNKEISIYD